jgi:tRNA modification GTPase
MSEPDSATTTVACLTPPGAAAIATLGLHGPRAWTAVRALFRPARPGSRGLPEEPAIGHFWLGRLGGDVADEVVVAARAVAPVPVVEVHCHGGREVVRMLLEAFTAQGLCSCSWQEFLRRTTADPIRAAAAAALAEARTQRTAAVLLDQYQGALSRAVAAVHAAWERSAPAEAGRLLEGLARHAVLGRHLTTPWRVVVAGAPNVGKSSLVNALAGFARCVVSPTPGTTRDVVTTLIAVDGWPIELADTAGLREEAGALEEQGIELARTAARDADLCLWLLDASGAPVGPPPDLASVRVVVNKVDLPPAWDLAGAGDALHVSARTGAGLEQLCQALSRWLVPDPPGPGAAVPFGESLCRHIERAWHAHAAGHIEEARSALAAVP